MAFRPDRPICILVCYGRERNGLYPHWMLMAVSEGLNIGTWYHSVGGPTHDTPYHVSIEGGKRLDSRGIDKTELIGTIAYSDRNKLKAAAQRVPAQQCQRYVVALVHALESKGLANKGEAVRLNRKVQMSDGAQAYAIQNPVTHPSGAYMPPSRAQANASSSRPLDHPPRQPQDTQGHPRPQHPSNSRQRKSEKSSGCCIIM